MQNLLLRPSKYSEPINSDFKMHYVGQKDKHSVFKKVIEKK
jgi:hypothetical protein